MGALTSIAELIAKGFPEEVAKRIASGELPMDEASRLARRDARYVDEGLVHVNRGGIKGGGFDNSRLPVDDPDTPFNAHWFTTDPHPSTAFRRQGSNDPITYTPVLLEKGRRGDWRDVVKFGESPEGMEAGYGTDFREGLLANGVSDLVVRGGDKIEQSVIDALPVGKKLKVDPDNKYGDRRNSLVKNEDGSLGFYEGSEHILDYDDLADYQRFNPEIKDVAVLDNTIIRSPSAAFDPQYKGSNIMGKATVPGLAATAAGGGALATIAANLQSIVPESTMGALADMGLVDSAIGAGDTAVRAGQDVINEVALGGTMLKNAIADTDSQPWELDIDPETEQGNAMVGALTEDFGRLLNYGGAFGNMPSGMDMIQGGVDAYKKYVQPHLSDRVEEGLGGAGILAATALGLKRPGNNAIAGALEAPEVEIDAPEAPIALDAPRYSYGFRGAKG